MSPTVPMVSRRVTVACLVLAPLFEVVEGALSPLKGTSNRADLAGVAAHPGAMTASVVVGLVGTLLYVPAFLGLASRTAARSRRLALVGLVFSVVTMLGFGGARMIGAVQISAVQTLDLSAATRLFDHLYTNPIAVAAVVAMVLGTVLGYPLLAASAWRAGLPKVAAGWFVAFPFVAAVADDNHWGNLATHLLLAASLGVLGAALDDEVLPPQRLLGERMLVGLLVAAPALEVVEQLLSPLAGTTTSADLASISTQQSGFVASVSIGVVATALYVPAFLGLAARCLGAAPVAARIGGFVAVGSMICFEGVRMVQGVELQLVRDGGPHHGAVAAVDGITGNAAGLMMLVVFLGGSVVGMVALAIALWKRGLPRPAVVLMGAFPVLDLALPGHVGTIASHALLLVALTWVAVALRGQPSVGVPVREPIGVV